MLCAYLALKGSRLLRTVQGPCHPFELLCAVLAGLNVGLEDTLSYTL